MGIFIIEIERFGMGSLITVSPAARRSGSNSRAIESPPARQKASRQDIGDAFLPAPNGLMPHAVINIPGDHDSSMWGPARYESNSPEPLCAQNQNLIKNPKKTLS